MPELPEVETTRRGIEPLIINRSVEKVLLHNASLRWEVPQELTTILPGQSVQAVDRRSKYLLINFEEGTLIVHLGMTGHLRCADVNSPRRKHDHIELLFNDGRVLRYNDSRRFGAMFWTGDNPLLHERLSDLGPEPLGEDFDGEYLYRVSRKRNVAVKPFLMNAKVVVGVGNIYASEALFRAGIRPDQPAGKISLASYQGLTAAVRAILREAIAAGGTTIRDFADTEGRPGYFKQELNVYGRNGKPCRECQCTIVLTRLGQRSTYHCPKCQR